MKGIFCLLMSILWIVHDLQAKPNFTPWKRRLHETRGVTRKDKVTTKGKVVFTEAPIVNYDQCSSEPLSIKESAIISSPNYPRNYPSSAECRWLLVASPDERIKLHFESFELASFVGCDSDYLWMTIGSVKYKFCGDEDDGHSPMTDYLVPEGITQVSLHFTSDFSREAPGFRIQVTIDNNDPCHGAAADVHEEGQITSPGYPQNYPRNSHCRWRIQAAANQVIKLRIVDLQLEDERFCRYDALTLSGGGQSMTVCKPDLAPFTIAIQSNSADIEFFSDESNNEPGFQIDAIFQDYCMDIPFLVYESGAVVTSPGFGTDDKYPADMSCFWELQAPRGKIIEVHFTYFDVEDSIFCNSHDYLQFWSKVSGTQQYCGRSGSSFSDDTPPEKLTFNTNEVSVRFLTDDFTISDGSGFRFQVFFRDA